MASLALVGIGIGAGAFVVLSGGLAGVAAYLTKVIRKENSEKYHALDEKIEGICQKYEIDNNTSQAKSEKKRPSIALEPLETDFRSI